MREEGRGEMKEEGGREGVGRKGGRGNRKKEGERVIR